jgi:SAM-dependent methyltransferase
MTTSARFRAAYAHHRKAEGRGAGGATELLALPYLPAGPLARQWGVRARSYEALVRKVVLPLERERSHLDVLDLGAGNGWLCYRLALRGHRCVAIDWRRDGVDGLGAGAPYAEHLAAPFERVAASFDAIPLDHRFDLVVFNAAVHYSTQLARTLGEATRVTRPGGHIAILDTPFYHDAHDGERMVRDKRAAAAREWGEHAADLLALDMIEFLTRERLEAASASYGLAWTRHRVRYPLWYELRPIVARVRGARPPSRFDVWDAVLR